MLQWIRSINIHPFHLTLPVLALYYWMYTGHLLAPIFLLAFFILFSRRYNGKQFLILVGLLLFAALCFAFRVEHGKQEARDQEVPRVIQLLPDTIKVNEMPYPFVLSQVVVLFRFSISFRQKKNKPILNTWIMG